MAELNNNMNDDELAEIVDLDGKPYEIIGGLEHEGCTYYALIPYEDEDESEVDMDEEVEFVILEEKETDNEDEAVLVTIDDDVLYEKIGGMFLEFFEQDDDEEDE
jgi:uncharacterized protein YrzB (UPF0473 family)